MALETGLSFEAENADQFLRALDDGADAVGRFESASESAEKGIDVFGEIAVGALRSIGETAIEWIGSAVEVIGQAVDSVISFGKESLLGAAEDEQAFVKMQQALKRLGDQAPVTEEQALALAESYKMLADGSADTIVGVEEQILKFPELSGRFEELIPIVLDFAALTGQKATSAAFQLSRSLADPERAIRVLRQAGIILNDQEREQIKTFMEMGDTASAQGLIIDKLKDKTGGMAEALAGTAKQQWALFTMTIAEAGETIMGKFLPVLEDLYNKYIKPNLPLIDQFASSIGEIIDLLITGDFKGGIFGLMEDDPWIAALFNARNAVMGLVDWVGKLIPWLMDFWKNNIQSSIPAITQWASLLGEKIPGYLAMFKDLLEKARPSIERMLEAGQKLFDAFLASWPQVQKATEDVTGSFGSNVGDKIPGFIDAVTKAIEALTVFWEKNGDQIIRTASFLAQSVGVALGLVIRAVQAVVDLVTNVLGSKWFKTFTDMVTVAENGKLGIVNIVNSLVKDVKFAVENIINNLKQAGLNWVRGIIQGISQGADELNRAVDRLARDALNALKRVLGIHSNSKVAALEIGLPMGQGIADGVLDALGSVRASLGAVTMGAMQSVSQPGSAGGGGYYNYAPTSYGPQFSQTIHAQQANAGSVVSGFQTMVALYGGAA